MAVHTTAAPEGTRGRTRRALLAAAGAGGLLAGCGSALVAAPRAEVPVRFRVTLVGFPASVASALGLALTQCAGLYARAGGVRLDLHVNHQLLPSRAQS